MRENQKSPLEPAELKGKEYRKRNQERDKAHRLTEIGDLDSREQREFRSKLHRLKISS